MTNKIICFYLSIILSWSLFAAVPAGYYTSLNGKQAAALKTELHNILMADTSRYFSYGSGANNTWNGFYYTDRDTINNLVIDMYSPTLRYFASNYISINFPAFGQELHIEHSLPKSWWSSHEWAAYKDLNHLFPADGSTNLSKNDNPMGIVTGTPTKDNGVSKIGPANYPDYSGNVFEPADQYKGDFARTYFYMATAYEHYKNLWDITKPENMMEKNTYPVFKTWAINLLLQWSRQDLTTPRFPTRGYWFSVSNAPVGADIHPCLAPQSINKAFQWDFTNPTFLSKSKFHNRLKNPTNNQAVGYA